MSDRELKNPQNHLLSAKALGNMLSLSKRQVFRLNSLGKLPEPIRIGGAVRWSAQEIADWLAVGAPDRAAWNTLRARTREQVQ